MSSRKPNAGDKSKAVELRALRIFAGYNQEQAAELLEVSTQQYGKYERGEDRISASQFDAAKRLFRPKALVHGGLSEDGTSFIAGPTAEILRPRNVETLKREWEQLKRSVDRYLSSLPDTVDQR